MNKTTAFILTFLGSGMALFLIFYFYPARIFDVNLIGQLSENAETVDLQIFLGLDADFIAQLERGGIEMKRLVSGWLILIILLLGLPAMIAYRVTYAKKREDTPSQSEEQTD